MRVWGLRTLSSIIVKVNNSGYDATVKVKLAKLALTHTGKIDSMARGQTPLRKAYDDFPM